MKGFHRLGNRWIFVGIAAVVALLLGTGVLASASGDPDTDNGKVVREGKVRVVVVDGDGDRHEHTYEFDSDHPRPFLGVVTGKAPNGGVLVKEVVEDSGAERAGLQGGDVIVGFNGEEIEGSWDLTRRILESEPGDRVELDVIRDGDRRTVTAELGERDDWIGVFGHGFDSEAWEHLGDMAFDSEALEHQMEMLREHLQNMEFDLPRFEHRDWFRGASRPRLGVQLVQPTAELREHLGGSGDAGVLVSRVLPDTPAETSDVRVGDLIVAVDGSPVGDAGDVRDALRHKSGETIELELIRDQQPMTLDVFLPEREEDDEPHRPRA